MSGIDIDDLGSPVISPEGRAVLDGRAAIPIDFSMDAIIAATKEHLDVPFYQDEYMLDSLERFIMEGNQNCGGFSPAGKGFFAIRSVNMLEQRGRIEHMFVRHPEINDREIEAPIILTGLPRSGTTNLSNIIAADKSLNSLTYWETFHPIPSLGVFNGTEKDTRDEDYRQALADGLKIVPLFKNMVDVPHDGAMEEIHFADFAGAPLGDLNRADTPNWRDWFWHDSDPEYLYTVIKKTILAIDFIRDNKKRWLLKSPHHLAFLPTVDKLFPNATWVVNHRDPASSFASNATMMAYLHRENYDKPDTLACCKNSLDMLHGMLGGMVRDIEKLDPARVEHVYFHEYMADTMGTLKKIYERADQPWTPKAESQLKNYIDSHPRGRHGGRLVYQLERDFHTSREKLHQEYKYYLDKFPDIKKESSHG